MFYVIGVLGVLTALILIIVHRFLIRPYQLVQFYKNQKLPVHFKSLKGFIHFQWSLVATHNDFFSFQKQLIKQNRSERAFVTNVGPKPTVYLIEPVLIKEFLVDKHDSFEKAPLIGLLKCFGSRGLFLLEGQEWKQRKKIISEAFRYDLLRVMVSHVVKIGEERLNKFSNFASNKEEINILKEFEFMAGEVIGRFFLGKSFTDIYIDGQQSTAWISDLFGEVIRESVSLWTLTLGPKFVARGILPQHKRLVAKVNRCKVITQEFVNQRKVTLQIESAEKEQKDLLTILLTQQAGSQLTSEDIVDEYLTFLIAGTDTTARLETLTLYFLSQNPQCLRRLREEISQAFSDLSQVTLEKVNQMEYFTAVIKETLRLATPSPHVTFRNAIKDVRLKDILIKKGTWITVCFLMNNYNEKNFKDPYTFDPERFIKGSPTYDEQAANEPFAFTPFGGGPRTCIGQNVAMIEAKIILSLFLKRFEFEIPKDYQMRYTQKMLLEPHDPLKIRLTERK